MTPADFEAVHIELQAAFEAIVAAFPDAEEEERRQLIDSARELTAKVDALMEMRKRNRKL